MYSRKPQAEEAPVVVPQEARRRILLVGATGLLGTKVIEIASARQQLRLITMARRAFAMSQGTKLELLVAPSECWPQAVADICPDSVICALGTTWRKSGGSEEQFRAVDHDLVLDIARAAKESGVHGFVQISSAGANARSKNFYLKTKGEVEAELLALKLPRLDILRPGLIRGSRKGDIRPLEFLGKLASPLTDMAMTGERVHYHSVSVEMLAEAALQFASEKARGRFTHEYEAIRLASKRFNY
jgi:uncharacterized protein YbjT (DUF2867 family)